MGRGIYQRGRGLTCSLIVLPSDPHSQACFNAEMNNEENFLQRDSFCAIENPSPSLIFSGSGSVRCIPEVPRKLLRVVGGLTHLLRDWFGVGKRTPWEGVNMLMGWSNGCLVGRAVVRNREVNRVAGDGGERGGARWLTGGDLHSNYEQWEPWKVWDWVGNMMDMVIWNVNLCRVLSEILIQSAGQPGRREAASRKTGQV